MAQAVAILKRSPILKNVSTHVPKLSNIGYITWSWSNGKDGGDAIYAAQTPTQMIYLIRPYFLTKMTLRDYVQSFGEPEQVIATFDTPDLKTYSYDLLLVYMSRGITLFAGGLNDKPNINLDMYVDNLSLFHNSVQGFNAVFEKTIYNPKLFISWQSFKSFDFYCRTTNGDGEVIPCPLH